MKSMQISVFSVAVTLYWDFKAEVIDSNDLFSGLLVPAGEDFCQILQDNFHTKFPSYVVSFSYAGQGLTSAMYTGGMPPPCNC